MGVVTELHGSGDGAAREWWGSCKGVVMELPGSGDGAAREW